MKKFNTPTRTRKNSKKFKRARARMNSRSRVNTRTHKFGVYGGDDDHGDDHDNHFGMKISSVSTFLLGLFVASASASSGSGPGTGTLSYDQIQYRDYINGFNNIQKSYRTIMNRNDISEKEKIKQITKVSASVTKQAIAFSQIGAEILNTGKEMVEGTVDVDPAVKAMIGTINYVLGGVNSLLTNENEIKLQEKFISRAGTNVQKMFRKMKNEITKGNAELWKETIGSTMAEIIEAVHYARTGNELPSRIEKMIENAECHSIESCRIAYQDILNEVLEFTFVPLEIPGVLSPENKSLITQITASTAEYYFGDLGKYIGSVAIGPAVATVIDSGASITMATNDLGYSRFIKLMTVYFKLNNLTANIRDPTQVKAKEISKEIRDIKNIFLENKLKDVPTVVEKLMDSAFEGISTNLLQIAEEGTGSLGTLTEYIENSPIYYVANTNHEVVEKHLSNENDHITNMFLEATEATKDIKNKKIELLRPSNEYKQQECEDIINMTILGGTPNWNSFYNQIAGPMQVACLNGAKKSDQFVDTIIEISDEIIDKTTRIGKKYTKDLDGIAKEIAYAESSSIATAGDIAITKTKNTLEAVSTTTKNTLEAVSTTTKRTWEVAVENVVKVYAPTLEYLTGTSYDGAFVSSPF
jgi:hypothetical protein